jgi:hypothetical protein
MALSPSTIPVRWHSGPLDIARREKSGDLTQQARNCLERWHEPAALDLLKNTPIDCVVLSWAAGLPEDVAQQKAAGPLVAAARQNNLEVVGWVEGTATPETAVASAKSAGLSAVAIKNFKGKSEFPVIPWGDHSTLPWDSTAAVLPITENVWPGVSPSAGGADADAGPTGLPWIDSNGWYVRMVRARVQTPVWLMFDPPGKGTVVQAQNYRMAVTDAEAAGARWVISLDDNLRAGLTEGNSSARQSWQQIVAAAGFFERHREWRAYRPLGLVGVISDFEGDNLTMSGEILNLMARRDLLHRVIWKSQAMAQPFSGLKTLVYVDEAQPAPELRRKIVQFVEQGGLLVTTPRWGREGKSTNEIHPRFEVVAYGKGRLAISKEDSIDPYVLAGDTQILLSHGNDLMKFFSSSSSGCTQYTTSPDGRKALLQGIGYASGRGGGALKTLWVRQRYASARMWLIDAAQAVSIEQKPAEDYSGSEYHLPAEAQGYIAVEFEN